VFRHDVGKPSGQAQGRAERHRTTRETEGRRAGTQAREGVVAPRPARSPAAVPPRAPRRGARGCAPPGEPDRRPGGGATPSIRCSPSPTSSARRGQEAGDMRAALEQKSPSLFCRAGVAPACVSCGKQTPPLGAPTSEARSTKSYFIGMDYLPCVAPSRLT